MLVLNTRMSLLSRVCKGDEVSWTEFYDTYAKLIYLCGKDWLLRDDEIDDLIQQVMSEIFQKDVIAIYKKNNVPANTTYKHDKSKGRFRDYLRKIIRNKAVDLYKARKKHEGDPIEDDSQVEDKATWDNWDQVWEDEWQKHVYEMALQELRQTVATKTYRAFELYAVNNLPIKEVESLLAMSEDAIYKAKSRCMDALQKIIADLENNGPT